MNQIKRATHAAAAVVILGALITACGGGDDTTSGDTDQEVASLGTEPEVPVGSDVTGSSAPTDPEEAQLAFAECMREHGIDMPDPGAGGGIAIEATPETEDEMNAAMEACQPLLENARGAIEMDPEQEAEMREQVLEFTECMREQGIDMPDPVFSDNGGFTVQAEAGEGDATGGGPRADDDFQAAAEECGGEGGGMMISGDTVADGMMPRWLIAGGTVVAVAAAATVGVAVGSQNDDSNTAAATTPAADLNVTPVVRRDLARNEEVLDGTVGFGPESQLVLPQEGTVTSLPEEGAVIDHGSVIAAVDDEPVIAMRSDTTLWRDLGPSVEDGDDVLAIERMLAQLGYAADHDVTVDGDWTDATTSAVKAFQEDHGQDDDGEITRGDIVSIPGPLRIAAVAGILGQPASEAGITVTEPEQSVNVSLDITDATLLAVGDAVSVELPDGSSVAATVASIGEASTDESGATTIPVEVTVDGGTGLPTGTPVDVLVSIVAATDVLAVPVEAVLALAEGGYAVEVRDGTSTQLIGVELGTFADGFVEITGDVPEGAEVVIA